MKEGMFTCFTLVVLCLLEHHQTSALTVGRETKKKTTDAAEKKTAGHVVVGKNASVKHNSDKQSAEAEHPNLGLAQRFTIKEPIPMEHVGASSWRSVTSAPLRAIERLGRFVHVHKLNGYGADAADAVAIYAFLCIGILLYFRPPATRRMSSPLECKEADDLTATRNRSALTNASTSSGSSVKSESSATCEAQGVDARMTSKTPASPSSTNDESDSQSVDSDSVKESRRNRLHYGLNVTPPIPRQQEAHCYYKYLMPGAALIVILGVLVGTLTSYFVMFVVLACVNDFIKLVTYYLAIVGAFLKFAWDLAIIVYKANRVYKAIDVPAMPHGNGLTHVAVIVTYKEPIEVLCRTFDSIVAQRGLKKRPVVLLAVEARDPTWQEAYMILKERAAGVTVLVSEHTLSEGEIAGKSSNENSAVRDLYNRYVNQRGMNPWEVMVSIVDADSILSPTYLANLEVSFKEAPDGRRTIYSGPLNTYRNFRDAGACVQILEVNRCHDDVFQNPMASHWGLSNYSITLGYVKEIGFWTPDAMGEDTMTQITAMLHLHPGRATVPVPSIICNDLVGDFSDRYTQAKRHIWGSICQFAWTLAAVRKLGLPAHLALPIMFTEVSRPGSYIALAGGIAGSLIFYITLFMAWHWWGAFNPDDQTFLLNMLLVSLKFLLGRWVVMWASELWIWRHVLTQFDIEHSTYMQWCFLLIGAPIHQQISNVAFDVVPFLACLYHITFISNELTYICAPKGDKFSSSSMARAA